MKPTAKIVDGDGDADGEGRRVGGTEWEEVGEARWRGSMLHMGD